MATLPSSAPASPRDEASVGVTAPEVDYQAFARDLAALRAELDARIDHGDLAHLQRLERWGRACTAAGYATAWIAPNPVSAFLISQGNTFRFTVMMHHVSHRGMDRVPGVPERYTSKGFAAGARRFVDWFDWILPEAWHHEHNVLHHYRTGEPEDPDLVEENLRGLRDADLPLPVKYAAVALLACIWKVGYYAPSTFSTMARARRQKADPGAPAPSGRDGHLWVFNPLHAEGREFWTRCLLPYAAARFGLVPALFLPLGPVAAANVLANSVLAEVMTNVHTFLLIVPNHAGSDLYRFEGRVRDRAEFCARQVIGSTNYRTGGDVLDFLQGFLNYQIEHHLWPDLPPRKYQEVQPRVAALCARHGLPYVQESVFRRAAKLVDVMVGKASMRTMDTRSARGPARG
jgi:fatty acid desaturase